MQQDRAAVEAFFAGHPLGLAVLDTAMSVVDGCGPATLRVSKTQVSLRRRDADPRWKEVAHVSSERWMHHLEVHDVSEVDGFVAPCPTEAYAAAG